MWVLSQVNLRSTIKYSTVKVKLQNARRKFGDLMDAGKDSLWFKQIVKNF